VQFGIIPAAAVEAKQTGRVVDRRIIREYLGWLASRNLRKISIARKLAVKSFYTFWPAATERQNQPWRLKHPFRKHLPEFISVENMTEILKMPAENTFEGIRPYNHGIILCLRIRRAGITSWN
jgi:site-specific recombinase XerD